MTATAVFFHVADAQRIAAIAGTAESTTVTFTDDDLAALAALDPGTDGHFSGSHICTRYCTYPVQWDGVLLYDGMAYGRRLCAATPKERAAIAALPQPVGEVSRVHSYDDDCPCGSSLFSALWADGLTYRTCPSCGHAAWS
jgi:hypothetical protein